jgi:hypothetical protein
MSLEVKNYKTLKMKKININSKIVMIVLFTITGLTSTLSCEDEPDFRIIPEERLAHSVIAISPDLSDIGTTVVITGVNFSGVRGNNRVSFNGTPAIVEEANQDGTALTVTVPEGATTGTISVAIGQTTVLGPNFNVVGAPVITDLSVTGGFPGDTVVITGDNFSSNLPDNIVAFGGIVAEVTAATITELIVTIPDGALSGDLTVTVFGQADDNDFTIAPAITSFDPRIGVPGDTVTITGTNFSTVASQNTVTFNGAEAEVTSASTTQLIVEVPATAADGPLTVEIEGLLATSVDEFMIDATTLLIPIAVEEDDVEESTVNGQMNLTSGDLELGELDTGFSPYDWDGLTTIGLRFINVDIPQGATVIASNIQFTADSSNGTEPVELTIYGEAVGNALPYTDTAFDLSTRTQTAASVVWTITEEWSTSSGEDKTDAQRTVDLSSIVQEIIDSPDWTPGNSINFFMVATGASATPSGTSVGREAEGFSDSNPNDTPEFTVTFIQ